MSCNGCRILRKGCSEDCVLRHCLEGIDNPQAQANATIFVSKFFGRAGLMSLISSVTRNQRPSLFQSLLYEAVGRTVNPTTGVVGLLWAGNWHHCQTAVMTVLCGGTIEPQPSEFDGRTPGPDFATFPQCGGFMPRGSRHAGSGSSGRASKRNRPYDSDSDIAKCGLAVLDLSLKNPTEERRAESPSVESETTTFGSDAGCNNGGFQANETKLLRLFV